MSLEMKVSYFAPARPGRVIAEGWIERRGRVTCFAEGRLLARVERRQCLRPGGEGLADQREELLPAR